MIEYWHNPRCSKSRSGLALLQDHGAEVSTLNYLDTPPSVADLKLAWSALEKPKVTDMMRTGEKLFRELGLDANTPDEQLFKAMADHPILIERPLAISGDRARIGRPPELLLDLL